MVISFRHINTVQTFNSTKFSADEEDSTYYLGNDSTTILQGTPDIKYTDVCLCKANGTLYSHGRFYYADKQTNDGNIMFTRNNVPIPLSAPNNTEKSTFSANQTENVVCNIEVPTTTSELTNDAKFGSLADILVDGKVILWNATTQKLVTATADQLRNLLMWIGTEDELRTLVSNSGLEEGKLYATLDNSYFS